MHNGEEEQGGSKFKVSVCSVVFPLAEAGGIFYLVH